jgi:hypothetical protein
VATTDFDVIIGGTKAKIKSTENGGYTKRTIRREIENNLLSQSENPAMVSRFDQRQLYQTSWAGGSRWWKPLLTPDDLSSYFQSNHMDVWSEPGKVIPTNQVVDAANTNIQDDCILVATLTDVFAVGSTSVTNASFFDVYKWTPGSDAFVRETAYHSGIAIADQPVSAVFNGTDGYIYVLCQDDSTSGRQISRFNPATEAQDDDFYTTSSGLKYGASIVNHREGIIFTAGGRVDLLTPAGGAGAHTTIFNDGQVELLSRPSSSTLFRTEELMVATPEGVYYAKNTMSGGQYQPWVWRLDKDSAGNWIGSPLAPLPTGSVALSIAYHLGSLIIATSPEPHTIIDQTEHAEIVLYHYTGGQPGALGSMLGGRDEVDETPYGMLGTNGALLYIGGHKRLWIYDATRGGLHTAWEWGTANTLGPYRSMAWVRDSDDEGALIFLGPDRIARVKRASEDDPDIVASFGADEAHYTLESNFFDGGLPMETKELTRVAIHREAGDGEQEWTVQISADGGAFADALVHSATSQPYAEADLSGVTGRKFRYKLIYQTKDTNRNALEALMVSLTTGEMVTEWDLILDGTEFLNVDNEVQDEETFYDAMVTLAGTQSITTFMDNMKEQGRETDSATTVAVKVMAVEIVKSKAGESDAIRVVVREA